MYHVSKNFKAIITIKSKIFLWKLCPEYFLDLCYISEFPKAFVNQFDMFLFIAYTLEDAEHEDINKNHY
jgi:hypothetical protein